jgi:hypothetical protein
MLGCRILAGFARVPVLISSDHPAPPKTVLQYGFAIINNKLSLLYVFWGTPRCGAFVANR